jgi:hypothetical protein
MDRQPSQQEIAQRAYALWEREGRPHGRNLEHWLSAESELAQAAPITPLSADIPAKPARRVAKSGSKDAAPKMASKVQKAKPRARSEKPAAKDLH